MVIQNDFEFDETKNNFKILAARWQTFGYICTQINIINLIVNFPSKKHLNIWIYLYTNQYKNL